MLYFSNRNVRRKGFCGVATEIRLSITPDCLLLGQTKAIAMEIKNEKGLAHARPCATGMVDG